MPRKRRTKPRKPSPSNTAPTRGNCWGYVRADRYWGLTPEVRTLLAQMWWLRPLVRTEKYVLKPSWPWRHRYVSTAHMRQDIVRQDKATKEFLDAVARMLAKQVLEELYPSRKSGQVRE